MTGPRIGSLCTGYGGLDQGVQRVLGGETVWVSDIDKGANKLLAYRYTQVPNLGDFTRTNWSTVEPVDVLAAGFPCQPVSHAGKRQGDLDERWLWDDVARAVGELRPGLVVLENVRGLLTAGGGRLFGRVVGALADLGYDASWHGLRAADVGAPHGRWRVFILATDTRHGAGHRQWARPEPRQGSEAAGHAAGLRRVGREAQLPRALDESAWDGTGSLLPSPRTSDTNGAGVHGDGGLDLRTAVSLLGTPRCSDGIVGDLRDPRAISNTRSRLEDQIALLPTPRAGDGEKGGPNQRGSSGDLMLPSAVTHLLPTPAVNDMGEGKTVEAWDEWTGRMKAAHGNGNGHGASLAIEAQRLLPTPTSMDSHAIGGGYNGQTNVTLTDATARGAVPWGQYADAIRRWETITRPAPPPTEVGPKGNPRLSARFSEWLMGLPDGWITDVPGVTRNEALKLAGNGVVPQQAETALRFLLSVQAVAA